MWIVRFDFIIIVLFRYSIRFGTREEIALPPSSACVTEGELIHKEDWRGKDGEEKIGSYHKREVERGENKDGGD